ncbi:MAG: molecular chaperone HtpG [Cytophagales bacterium]
MQEKGHISIHTENIFPIIKKFLYSDHEIFLRELVSNAVDATQKLHKLAALGEFKGELGETKVVVTINKENKTLTVTDSGIGMTADEVKKYINQIAFSGAKEFLEKYKDKGEEKQIIGHFGLGFYSAFMVAKKVDIFTLSHLEGSEAVHWTCDGSTEFEIIPTVKNERGTQIVLHLMDDALEFLENYKVQSILDKYCRFLPVEVEFDGKIINETKPIWTKQPSELSDADYIDFYKKLYPFSEDPLFWIHLNVDYPFNLTGVLYFPKLKKDFEPQKNKIQLFSKQVFITDEVKDIVPEFLMLLHGVIDSPDIPLNVSRSYLQADGNVKKINTHISKKVADKLNEIFKNDREGFMQKWEHLGLFVKFGMISDDKFSEKAKDFCLLSNLNKEHFTIAEYKEKTQVLQKDKNGNLIWLYANDKEKLASFANSASKRSYDVLLMDSPIDNHFIDFIERKEDKLQIKRVDSDTIDKLIEKEEVIESVLSDEDSKKVKESIEKALNNSANMKVEVKALPTDEMPVNIVMPEFMRRMKEMGGFGGMAMFGAMPETYNVVVNGNHPAVLKLAKLEGEENEKLAKHLTDLGLLCQQMLSGDALTQFVQRSLQFA